MNKLHPPTYHAAVFTHRMTGPLSVKDNYIAHALALTVHLIYVFAASPRVKMSCFCMC